MISVGLGDGEPIRLALPEEKLQKKPRKDHDDQLKALAKKLPVPFEKNATPEKVIDEFVRQSRK